MELEMKSQHTSLLLLAIISFQICLTEQLSTPAFPLEYNEFSGSLYAACRMRPNTKLAPGMPRVYGRVLFKQQGADGKLKVSLKLHGFETTDQHLRAIHIHQYGDLGEGCTSTGGHYNPFDVNHPGHPGDFGNFAPQNGRIQRMIDSTATLLGPKSVLGRAVVIHEKEDDLGRGGDAGSLLHGNAGARLACCVIGISKARQKEQG